MKKILFLVSLFIFMVAGIGSAILLATDWNSLASGESFAGLGILLFFIGAGLGAVIVLFTMLIISCFKTKTTVEETTPKTKDSDKSYDIQVDHFQDKTQVDGKEPFDTSLFQKIGYNTKSVLYKISVYMANWKTDNGNSADAANSVFTPTQKSWEKNVHCLESVTAATPRIYVLPPDSPIADAADTNSPIFAKRTRKRSQSELPPIGKLSAVPDVTILDIKQLTTEEESFEDDEDKYSNKSSAFMSQCSDLNSVETEETPPYLCSAKSEIFALPAISMIDTHLDDFVKSLPQGHSGSELPPTFVLSIMIEEVLPRPDSGFLKRMLRMSEIPVGMVEGIGEPILYLRVGSECHISVGLIQIQDQSSSSFRLTGPHSMTLKPVDGEEVDLNVNCEAVDNIEHVGSAFWDLKKHSSDALSHTLHHSSNSTILTPIEMTLGFHLYREGYESDKKTVFVKKTFMSCMRSDVGPMEVQDRYVHEDSVVDFLLTKMELISMPSLLMFLQLSDLNKDQA